MRLLVGSAHCFAYHVHRGYETGESNQPGGDHEESKDSDVAGGVENEVVSFFFRWEPDGVKKSRTPTLARSGGVELVCRAMATAAAAAAAGSPLQIIFAARCFWSTLLAMVRLSRPPSP